MMTAVFLEAIQFVLFLFLCPWLSDTTADKLDCDV